MSESAISPRSRGHRRDHKLSTLAATFLAALVLAAPAAAQSPSGDGQAFVPEDNSALDEYVPSVPEPGGRSGVGGDSKGGGAGYGSRVTARLPGGAEGALLRSLATSAALGAPSQAAGSSGHGSNTSSGGSGASANGRNGGSSGAPASDQTQGSANSSPSLFGALVRAGATLPGLALLLLVLVAILTSIVVLARRKRS